LSSRGGDRGWRSSTGTERWTDEVVPDTNVHISALFWRGNPYRILRLELREYMGVKILPSAELLKLVSGR